ncbi:Hypothetical predicted protein [Paramuricea clavata]|uniref:Coiled-coil domain-containing protein 43 n=1 Tax=Paramuricea clavata TaxID=317549 RepID=A0A6S7HLW8_PARCT|nr:Hypothetical predicted protein [Paramuricea clavata]
MAGAGSEFHVWLCSRLKSLNLDEEVLGEYISGILDGDDSTPEEKEEALKETLEGMMESPDDNVSSDIFMKWKECEEKKAKLKQESENQKQDILAAVVEKQMKTTNNVNKKPSHKLDENVKKNLIAQYELHISLTDITSSSDEEAPSQTTKSQPVEKDKGVFQNTNTKSVLDKEKEKRDKQRQENEDKKVKDKEDREKQKTKAEQRKDKEKKRTQKGERRR